MNAMPDINPTTFAEFWLLGFHRLVPIIPPDAQISENSSLNKRGDARGKAVGVRGSGGQWYGFDWVNHESTKEDIGRWQAMGAGIGIKTGLMSTGRTLILIDADTMHADYARIIRDLVEEHFGRLSIRVGQYPKAGYLLVVEGEFRYTRVEFGENERVEILSDGRQFVAHGMHPKTREAYHWPRPIVPANELPTASPEEVRAFMSALQAALPAAKPIIREGAASDVNQASLKGDLEHVRRAVEAIPNTSELFPTRESYVHFGYAIKAALPDHPQEALALFDAWSDRWTDDTNPEGFAAGEWSRMKPPYKRGASWLYDLAHEHGHGQFNMAEIWFQPVNDNDNPFDQPMNSAAPEVREAIKWINPIEWSGVDPKPREWEVEGWIPRNEVTLLYGDGGIGKTLLTHQYATCAAAGVDWLGQSTRRAKVMCFFCEDSEEELHRRQIEINRHLGLEMAATADSLRIACRRYMDNLMALWERSGAMQRTAVWAQLVGDAKAFGADVIVLDTLADIYAGDEVNRAQVTAFVKSCLGRLAQEIGGSVIVLGHPSLSGKSSGSGTSGSTAWSNAVRSRLYLRFPKGTEKGNVRELEGMKMNYGPKGGLLKLRWKSGAFEAVASNMAPSVSKIDLNPFKGEGGGGASAAHAVGGGVPGIEGMVELAIVNTLRLWPEEGMSLGSAHSRTYAPRICKRLDADAFEMFGPEDIEAGFERLLGRGAIKACEVAKSASRHPVMGFREAPAPDNLSGDTGASDKMSDAGGVFD